MSAEYRVSVRNLVAFSYFVEDIVPSGGVREMQLGAEAHRARQSKQEGQAERALSQEFSTEYGSVLVYGRMDAFTDGDIPFIEEIKMSSWADDAPQPEHRAQALCYAAMVALGKPCERVRISVTYVNEQGEILRAFEEVLEKDVMLREMNAMLEPYMRFASREQKRKELRDESLRALTFPYNGYRAGQRELAAQVYTAISRKKRLFASLPTGTGKSAAVIFPALKAIGEGKTGRIIYLTSRNTARQSPLNTLERIIGAGAKIRVSTLTAKEKLCPNPTHCSPEWCPRAKGHFVRQAQAIDAVCAAESAFWDDDEIVRVADEYSLCPFEFALALCEYADISLMDLNYAFDPMVQVNRLFGKPSKMTLLVDEAHHTVDRVRDSLSGFMDGQLLAEYRASYGKAAGRKNPYYKALGGVIHSLRSLAPPEGEFAEYRLETVPKNVIEAVEILTEEAVKASTHPVGGTHSEVMAVMRLCFPFLSAFERLDEDYAILLEKSGREFALTLYCLLPAKAIHQVTKPLRGTVFFSATLTPLDAMKQLLGGDEDDACFSLPSPFPPERLKVIRRGISTRYADRTQSAEAVARSISEAVLSRRGKYIAFFPSYAYMSMVSERLSEYALPPVLMQKRVMDDDERAEFFAAFDKDAEPKLGLCVLGGLFSEGVDLPGDRLIGVIIVGVGLPTPSLRLKTIQECYARHFGDGFGYACRMPAMHKVLQAGGRVVRSERDKGLILLIDDRYFSREYTSLLPPEWLQRGEDISKAAKRLEELK